MVDHTVNNIIKTRLLKVGLGTTDNETTLAYSLSFVIPNKSGIRFVYAWSRDGSYKHRYNKLGQLSLGNFGPNTFKVQVAFWKVNFGISVVGREVVGQ